MNSPELTELILRAEEMPWRAKSLPGVSERMLWRDDDSGASIAQIKIEKGCGIPQNHCHASNQFMFVLSGSYKYLHSGEVLTTGSFYWNPAGNFHGPTEALEDTVFLEVYDGPHYPQRPDWYDNDEDAR
ncbi:MULTISPECIES: cupin domain-containing protein [Mycolicibacterium]|uniref:Cupin n=1 Tax=Mycolicibacterium holsaticum TaxID=152142 RepID=A0A1E3RUH8_9MYCO|nr:MULTISPECIES: DUF4437 domain-containing protein [Mycolicibacterium]MDA4110652.1 cupin [Mycolicibacterium holsaticum DSM 44478 = JCM 12374]OBF01141.1 cupin [Mycolicibacterium elephantis]ODQ93007.1 cupin [Mycolicibacterium holsaticum]QZA14244.1 cupin domain-containing protein [Mycolicibacterium holsaticum DSM 44478 = JCM 12374]UNC08303.1 cupin domain-containing protein [Mycolicibacterium holsaticum DSM 44478 = JCM 12374]